MIIAVIVIAGLLVAATSAVVYAAREKRSISSTVIERSLLALTLLVGAFSIFIGLTAMAGGGDGPTDLGYTLFGLAGLSVGAMLLGGVYLSGRHPWPGNGLTVAGAVAMAATLYWMLVISVPLALLIVVGVAIRARGLSRTSGALA